MSPRMTFAATLGLAIGMFWCAAPAWGQATTVPTTGPAVRPGSSPAGPAAEWLRRAQADLRDIVDVREQGVASWEIIRLWARGGDERAAAELADLTFARPHRWYLQEVLTGEQAQGGAFDAARKTAAEIGDELGRARATIEIVQLLALTGDVKGAKALADEFKDPTWLARAYGEIAGAQARGGDYAGARATADTKPAEPLRDKILSAVAEMQGLAGDPEGAAETAGGIKDTMLRDVAKMNVEDNKPEAAFRKAWGSLAEARRFSLPRAEVLGPGTGGLMFEALTGAIAAKDQVGYERAIANAAGIAARVRMDSSRPLRARDPSGQLLPIPAERVDPTIIQRGVAYTLIAVVEAAHKDLDGARAMIARAIETGEQEKRNDLFTGTCGAILAATLVKIGNAQAAVDYAVKLQIGHPYGIHVARAVGFALAEQGKIKELGDYLAKLDAASHRIYACIGAAAAFIGARNKPPARPGRP